MPKINDKITRQKRREAAEARQGQYNALSTEQKLSRAKERRGLSLKEQARLSAS
jgi:hypothetical protein